MALAFSLQPEKDESWLSYLKRTSRAYGLPIGYVARALGAAPETGTYFHPAFTLEPTQKTLRVWEGDQAELREMFLSRFAPLYGDAWRVHGTRLFSSQEWLHLFQSPVCPVCLAEGAGHWRVQWHVPFVFMCLEHDVLLSHKCPGCGKVHGHGHRDGKLSPLFVDYTADTRRCMNPGDPILQPEQVASKRPCDFELARIPAVAISHQGLAAAQRMIVDVLEGRTLPQTFGHEVSVRSWFYDLRTLVAYFLYAGDFSLADGLPSKIVSAWGKTCEQRDAEVHARQGDRAKGSRDHSFKSPPPPALMAVAALHGLAALHSPAATAPTVLSEINELANRESLRRSRTISSRAANSLPFAIAAHEAALAARSVKQFLMGHPQRGDSQGTTEPKPIDGRVFATNLPATSSDIEPGWVIQALDLMVRFFRDPSAKNWADAKTEGDPPTISSMINRLVSASVRHGEARALGRLVVDIAVGRTPSTSEAAHVPSANPVVDIHHVPSLLPSDEFGRHFGSMFAQLSVDEQTARATASYLIALAGTGLGSKAVLDSLMIPQGAAQDRILRCCVLLRGNGMYERAMSVATARATALASEAKAVNFTSRARTFRDLTRIPLADWIHIAAMSGTKLGQEGAADNYAAAVVWASLTSGDWRHSPALLARQGDSKSSHDLIFRFGKHASRSLRDALEQYASYLASGGTMGHFHGADNASGETTNALQPRHVPQLIWEVEYRSRFEEYFRRFEVSERVARAACSVMLLERLVAGPRERLGTYLGYDVRRIRGGISRAIQLASAGAKGVQIGEEVRSLIASRTAAARHVDFQARRERLSWLQEIPAEAWQRITKSSRIMLGKPGGRRTQSAMWLWAHLTEGDSRMSPAFLAQLPSRPRNSVTTSYDSFCTRTLPKVRTALVAYGLEILSA